MRTENAGVSRFAPLVLIKLLLLLLKIVAGFRILKFIFIFRQLYPMKCCKKINGGLH